MEACEHKLTRHAAALAVPLLSREALIEALLKDHLSEVRERTTGSIRRFGLVSRFAAAFGRGRVIAVDRIVCRGGNGGDARRSGGRPG